VVGVSQDHAVDRMKSRVRMKSAENAAATELLVPDSLEDKFNTLENEDKVEMLLKEMKNRRALP
jgi:phage shock protein A